MFEWRHLTKNKTMPTMMHQTGDLQLGALTLQQDRARGMFAACASTEEFRHSVFHLRTEEKITIPRVLQWLGANNPWHQAYFGNIRWGCHRLKKRFVEFWKGGDSRNLFFSFGLIPV